jgi:nucleotide-binding universal stress UspA family protein
VLRDASVGAELMVIARRRHAFPVGHLGGTARALLRESLAPVMVLPPAED